MLIAKPPTNPDKSIAYIRVSSQRQADEGVSIEAQEKRIKEYAQFKGLNLDDKDILIEKAVSGGIPLWERPRGRQLKQKLMRGKFANVITMKLDRMFRLVSDTLDTVDELSDAGIALHIVDMHGEAVDTSSSMGRFFLTIMAALAEMERGLITERTQMGMDQLKATHRKFTQSIYGWDVDVTGALIPNWNEQNIIDYMYWQMKVNGMSAASIARSVNAKDVKGKRGGTWQSGGVTRTIENVFHDERLKFPHPKNWGNKVWHRK